MTKYVAFNEQTRKYEQIDLEDAEMFAGQTVIKMYYTKCMERWATVPGASLYTINADGSLSLSE